MRYVLIIGCALDPNAAAVLDLDAARESRTVSPLTGPPISPQTPGDSPSFRDKRKEAA